MNRTNKLIFICKHFFLFALCVCLTVGLCSEPVKGTVSYITSLSVTCVNTFTNEGTDPGQPTPPDTDPNSPTTGDSSPIEWYVAGMLISLAGLAITLKMERKKFI